MRTLTAYTVVFLVFFSIALPAKPPPTAPKMVATVRPSPTAHLVAQHGTYHAARYRASAAAFALAGDWGDGFYRAAVGAHGRGVGTGASTGVWATTAGVAAWGAGAAAAWAVVPACAGVCVVVLGGLVFTPFLVAACVLILLGWCGF